MISSMLRRNDLLVRWQGAVGPERRQIAAAGTLPALLIIAASLALVTPELVWNLLPHGHDGAAHIAWQQGFASQLWQDAVFPRWLPEANGGFGSPVFFFYPPLAHLAAALLYPFTADPALVPLRLALASAAAMAIGAAGMLAWLRGPIGRGPALAAAFVYLLAPYHLLIDLYVRMAYAELWAFALAPWLFWAARRLPQAPRLAAAWLALLFAALLLSHAPSALALPPAILVYAAAVCQAERRPGLAALAVAALPLACLLAAQYLATAIGHADLIDETQLFDGRFHYANWFLFGAGRWPGGEIQPLILVVFLVQGGLGLVLAPLAARGRQRQAAWALGLISLGCAFMTTVWSAPVWQLLPMLQKVQFPWRLFLPQSVVLAALAGLAVAACRDGATLAARLRRTLVAAGMLGVALVNLAFLPSLVRRAERLEAAGVQESPDVPEYALGDVAELQRLFPDGARLAVLAGQGSAELLLQEPRRAILAVEAAEPMTLALHQFRYSGWRQSLDGQAATEAPACPGGLPLACAHVPPGRHLLTLDLAPTWSEHVGRLLSRIGIVLMLVLFGWARTPWPAALRRPTAPG